MVILFLGEHRLYDNKNTRVQNTFYKDNLSLKAALIFMEDIL